MYSHSVEKKMELVHSIRAENQMNRGLLRKREQIISGGYLPEIRDLDGQTMDKTISPQIPSISSFKIRFFIAILLFTSFVIMEIGNMSYSGIDSEKLHKLINEEVEITAFQ